MRMKRKFKGVPRGPAKKLHEQKGKKINDMMPKIRMRQCKYSINAPLVVSE